MTLPFNLHYALAWYGIGIFLLALPHILKPDSLQRKDIPAFLIMASLGPLVLSILIFVGLDAILGKYRWWRANIF